MQYKAQWGQRRREHCSMRSTSYTATSITEVPAFMYHHDCNSEHLNGKQTEDSELVALKMGETYAWTFGEKDNNQQRSDSVRPETGDSFTAKQHWLNVCKLPHLRQHLRVDNRTFKACVLAPSNLLKYYSRLCLYSLQLCFCELKRKRSKKIQTRAAFLKIRHIKAASFRLPSHPFQARGHKQKSIFAKNQRMCWFVGHWVFL